MTKPDDSAPAESMTPPPRDPLIAWRQAITPGAAPAVDPAAERDGVNSRAAKGWMDTFVTRQTGINPI